MFKNDRIPLLVFVSVSSFAFGFLLSWNIQETTRKLNFIIPISFTSENQSLSITNETNTIDTFCNQCNSTHLWSLRLADENYFRLARLLPCRIVEYTDVSPAKMNTCDYSSTDEFSITNNIQAQKWIYDHQNPANCSNKRFAIIHSIPASGFGSNIHQIARAFGNALAQDRIAVYETPGNWMYGHCSLGNPDCIFLPISNCSVPAVVDGVQTIRISAIGGCGSKIIHPPIFLNRTFNWYRAQLAFYVMRYQPQTLTHIQNIIAQNLNVPSIDLLHPYIAIYVRRSDKVSSREMSEAYPLKKYFDLFDSDARRANISTVYINSEDEQIFKEFIEVNKEQQGYYKLITLNSTRDLQFGKISGMSKEQRSRIVLEFLTDLYVEMNADLHSGTLTSNWCRLVDEFRFVLGKKLAFYTPENKYQKDC